MIATVGLHGIKFKAFHGYYAEEEKLGGYYKLHVSVRYDISKAADGDDLDKAVNYEVLYDICESEMGIRRKLIETVASDILTRVMDTFPIAQQVEVVIEKLTPPLKGEVNNAFIKLEKSRN